MAVFEVAIEETGAVYRCSSEESLLCGMERLGKRGIPVGCRCGGCGVCKVRIAQGDYQQGVMSRDHITPEEEAMGIVLAYRVRPLSAIRLSVIGCMKKMICMPVVAAAAEKRPR